MRVENGQAVAGQPDARLPDAIGIGWEVGVESGWGTYGSNLALQAGLHGVEPLLYFVSSRLTLDPLRRRLLQPALDKGRQLRETWASGAVQQAGCPVLHGLGDGLSLPDFAARIQGKPDVGVVFFESSWIPPENVEAARRFPLIIAGSQWNLKVLQDHGLENSALCWQGIDRGLFHPAEVERLFPGRFVVFSGGKLEYRKGQDLVVAAFRRFQQSHPEALLLTAWANLWPQGLRALHQSPHTTGIPAVRPDRSLAVDEWLLANGLPDGSFLDVGGMANVHMPQILRQADVGLFPNRCEGGTNLVAMEAMACGMPVILSNNTGHADLISTVGGVPTCWKMDMQLPLGELTGREDFSGWGETLVDEMVACLEDAWSRQDEARRRGAAAAAFMRDWDWSVRIRQLLQVVGQVSP